MLGRCSSTWARGGGCPLLQLSSVTSLPRLLRSSLLLPRTHLATPPTTAVRAHRSLLHLPLGSSTEWSSILLMATTSLVTPGGGQGGGWRAEMGER